MSSKNQTCSRLQPTSIKIQHATTISKRKSRVTTPYEFGNEGDKPEPFTKSYPEYGKGGARQLIPENNEILNINVDKSTILPSK